MSSRRSRRSPPSNDREAEIQEFVLKLQELIPQLKHNRGHGRTPAKILQETCNHIEQLHREVEELSAKLSLQLNDMEITAADVDLIRNILL